MDSSIFVANSIGHQKKLRKHFSKNRSELVETKLMQKQCHTIRYNTVPGKAMLKYSGKEGAFMRQDGERFLTWKNSLEKKVNTKTLHPVEIIRKYIDKDEIDPLLEEMWKKFQVPDVSDSIVLADVSGSMYSPDNKPISACLSLALLIAPTCAFPNQILTFSSQPELHRIEGDSLFEQMRNLRSAHWGASTNIQAAFEVILKAAKQSGKMPKRLIIISDMQFDIATGNCNWPYNQVTNFEYAKDIYQKA